MQKIVIILILFITSVSCSVIKQQKSKTLLSTNENRTRSVLEEVRSGNLSGDNFFIQKATVTISGNSDEEKFIVTLKYLKSGIYLISLRNRTGIEAARIYISNDTILANDRINRQLIYAVPDYLRKRYGISVEMLPVLFGDLLGVRNVFVSYTDCVDGEYEAMGLLKGVKLNYLIDCSIRKVIFVRREGIIDDDVTEIHFTDFFEQQNFLVPGKISIRSSENNSSIVIEINKLELLWTGDIEFIPGNGYEKVEMR